MRGIILAGGTGSRLQSLTRVTNKHLLAVGRWPMIYYPIHALVSAGVADILIVTGVEHAGDLIRLLGSGGRFGARFTYRVQDEAGGIAHALSLGSDFARGAGTVVILGDNVFVQPIRPFVEAFSRQRTGARVLLHRVPDPERYGVPVFEGGRIVRIEEKPTRPASHFCVTGVYMYDPDVFDLIRSLRPSARGELEITDVNNRYIARGALSFDIMDGWWLDAGTPESLHAAGALALSEDLADFDRRARMPGPDGCA